MHSDRDSTRAENGDEDVARSIEDEFRRLTESVLLFADDDRSIDEIRCPMQHSTVTTIDGIEMFPTIDMNGLGPTEFAEKNAVAGSRDPFDESIVGRITDVNCPIGVDNDPRRLIQWIQSTAFALSAGNNLHRSILSECPATDSMILVFSDVQGTVIVHG